MKVTKIKIGASHPNIHNDDIQEIGIALLLENGRYYGQNMAVTGELGTTTILEAVLKFLESFLNCLDIEINVDYESVKSYTLTKV